MNCKRAFDVNAPRLVSHPDACNWEKKWFEEPFLRPRGLTTHPLEEMCMLKFQQLIWEQPADDMIMTYGSSVNELAALCASGREGWLLSSHIQWLMDKINSSQEKVICSCLPNSKKQLQESLAKRGKTEQCLFVTNIGNSSQGTFLGSYQRPGCHWVLIIIDMKANTIMYCDSLGWDCPLDLAFSLQHYTGLDIANYTVKMMHSVNGSPHICNFNCKNFPLQTCSNVCGIISSICGVIYAMDTEKFLELTGSRNGVRIFIHDPTRYERFLRRVLICWFILDTIDLSFLFQKHNTGTAPQLAYSDHTYPVHTETINQTSITYTNKEAHLQEIMNAIQTDHTYQQPASKKQCLEDISNTSKECTNINPEQDTQEKLKVRKQSSSHDKKNIVCSICNMTVTKKAMYRHMKRKHNTTFSQTSNPITCTDCPNYTASHHKQYVLHQKEFHDKNITIRKVQFESQTDFVEWKKKIEQSTKSLYVKKSGEKVGKTYSTSFFTCHRSGSCKQTSKTFKRLGKLQGSCKTGHICTAFIKVQTHVFNKTVNAEYCLEHTGHTNDLAHLPLSSHMKKNIASKLLQGLPINKVLDDIREDITDINRDTLVTRQDIYNVKRQFNIFPSQKHKQDGISVDLWVEALKNKSDNPILFYKPQNTPHPGLKDDDFILCIQTDYQRTMLLKHGHKILFSDSTHKTTQYDFQLTTLLVLDDFEEGIPVAWAISNREDSGILEYFIHSLKIALGGDIVVDIFMSDMATNFYNAWCKVFSKPLKRLFCSWHVDKCWRKNIFRFIKTTEQQINIYAFLKDIQNEMNVNVFTRKLQQLMQYLLKHSSSFYQYFYRHYVSNHKCKFWAGCYRIGTLANTNMFAEAFHRVLKVLYFNKKQNRRVDSLLSALLKISRDKSVEHLIKVKKGKYTHRLKETKRRHKNAENINHIINKETAETDQWSVRSEDKDIFYNVKKVKKDQCMCNSACNECYVCIHMFTCTCLDYSLRHITCKHIHAIGIEQMKQNGKSGMKKKTDENKEDITHFISSVVKKERNNQQSLKEDIVKNLEYLATLVRQKDDVPTNALREIHKLVRNTTEIGTALMNIQPKQNFTKMQDFPPNKLHEKQRLFTTKKKKNKKRGTKLISQKPDLSRSPQLAHDLDKSNDNKLLICALCFCESDASFSTEVEWLKCNVCHAISHVSCNLNVKDGPNTQTLCALCRWSS